MGAKDGESKSDNESDVEQYELTEDEDEQQEEKNQRQDTPPDSAKRATGKRKRSLSQNDEEEIARRRRRRRSLAFQQRRRSLTSSEKKAAAGGSGGQNAPPAHSKQYISDMYSTIIKMSSENKINVKNSWSLHLIDHMEDILDSSKRIAADGDDDTYNFQKASCTLDASIKIYSYRVDDTWNSSYKILENLSRTEQKHGGDDAGSDAEGAATTARKTRKTHARTIEKNLKNINLKAYDTECEADPLFHKMSQSFDEGGAKGMLLANLSVYDGCRILLNSGDVSMVTRKPIHEVEVKSKGEPDSEDKQKPEKSDVSKANDTAVEAEAAVGKDKTESADAEEDAAENDEEGEDESNGEGKEGSDADVAMEEKQNKTAKGTTEDAEMDVPEQEKEDSSEDVTTEEDQGKDKGDVPESDTVEDSKGKEGDESGIAEAAKEDESTEKLVAKERISLSLFSSLSCIEQDVQNLSVCPPLYRMYDQLDEFYGDEARHKLGIKNDFLLTTPVKGRRLTLDNKDLVATNLAGILEGASEDESDGEDTAPDNSVDFGDDNADYDADEDVADPGGEPEDATEAEPATDVDMEKDNDVIDLAGSDDEDSLHDELTQNGIDKALDKESSLTSTAADFFRSKVNENLPAGYENNLFSQMIESALVRSATLEGEQGGDDQDGKNDYSYFDVKMLRNWAGPGHWKFPAVRKIQHQQEEEVEKEGLVDEDGVVIKAEPSELPPERVRKGSSAGVDKKAAITVDFFGEKPDLSRLKVAKTASSLEVSKGNLKKQAENSSDLVLPVDTHIELGLFFRHFLKERPRYFRKRGGSGIVDGAHREGASVDSFEYGDTSGDTADDNDHEQPFTYNEDSAGFEGGYDDEDEIASAADDPGTEALYSVEGLAQADRVVEKIGVHYERFAKRVDVKKLKGSIWDHLEKKVVKNDRAAEKIGGADQADSAVTINESGKRQREPEVDEEENAGDDTTFENVVESVAGKVPSNVTVSFYFICVLHLANEKGLELVGQDDLRNFQIRKE